MHISSKTAVTCGEIHPTETLAQHLILQLKTFFLRKQIQSNLDIRTNPVIEKSIPGFLISGFAKLDRFIVKNFFSGPMGSIFILNNELNNEQMNSEQYCTDKST
jgi:hypothetical protein